MNATITALRDVAAHSAKSEAHALEKAHSAAEEFHSAMSHAFFWQQQVEEEERDIRDPRRIKLGLVTADDHASLEDARKNYAKAIADAGVAFAKMPEPWRKILECELPKLPASGPEAA